MKKKLLLFAFFILSFLSIQSQQCKGGECQSILIDNSQDWSVSHGTPSWGNNSVWLWSYVNQYTNRIIGEGVNYSGFNFVQGEEYCISFSLDAQTNTGGLPNVNSSMNVMLTPNAVIGAPTNPGAPIPGTPNTNQQIMSENIWANGNGQQTHQFTFTASSNFNNLWFYPSNPARPNPQIEVRISNVSICRIPPCKEEIKLVKVGECDPCESGVYIIRAVNAAGNLVTNFNSITWSDGLYPNQNTRIGNVNTTYAVTIETPAPNGKDVCTYSNEIVYECEAKCKNLSAPINLKDNGNTLSWNPVPGAVSYIVSSPSRINVRCCVSSISIAPIQTNTNSLTLSNSLKENCFVWQVTAVCADGSKSPVSKQFCHMPREIEKEDALIKLSKEKISVYPNPNQGNVHVKIEREKDSDVALKIYRIDGTLVKIIDRIKTEKGVLDFDVKANLSKGMYFFNIKTSNGITVKQVIVE